MRGEYLTIVSTSPPMRELPPRTRRIHFFEVTRVDDSGTTSAYAENTSKNGARTSSIQNYLRVRGEYRIRLSIVAGAWELPPRTRRIHQKMVQELLRYRTTSAYAENTGSGFRSWRVPGNYLRARGEYFHSRLALGESGELPPRTRRIPPYGVRPRRRGTTSAHAENTARMVQMSGFWWNYLRARGEYGKTRAFSIKTKELPPRTRRIPK